MQETIKKLNYTTAIRLGFIFYCLTILVHILILTSIIPLSWINGGNSISLKAQLPLSIFNLTISLFGLCFMVFAHFNRSNKIVIYISRLLSGLWLFGFIQQFLGTPFEKLVISIILFIGLVAHIRLSIMNSNNN